MSIDYPTVTGVGSSMVIPPSKSRRTSSSEVETMDKIEARKKKLVASNKRLLMELEELKYDRLVATLPKVISYYELDQLAL
ncbi:hypothetical protein BC831DRAFT_465878 [Entophlyctis helioformis]|nr:hypothetical protein BC831DRAFT_465878 [Entophlyctis helioformis]